MTDLKVGSTVWVQSYSTQRPGQKWIGPYQANIIKGETPRLWLINSANPNWAIKLPKKRDALEPEYFISEQECHDELLAVEARKQLTKEADDISYHVRQCRDASILRQIAALVGYKPKGEA